MSDVNKVILIGRLGRDPEIRNTTNSAVANLRVATSRKWTDKRSGEKKEATEWHSVVVWGEPTVDFISKYMTKGTPVYVEGELQTRKWTDQQGVEKYSTEVVVQGFNSRIDLLPSGSGGESSEGRRTGGDGGTRANGPAPQTSREAPQGGGASRYSDLDDDIPF